jgi:hypothetical protein
VIDPRPGTKLYKPPKSSLSELPPHLRLLYNHVAHSFLPENQLTRPPQSDSAQTTPQIQFIFNGERQELDSRGQEDMEYEPVGAVISPFEGGEAYIRESVKAVAATLDAEVQVVDLSLALAGTDIEPNPFAPKSSKSEDDEGEHGHGHAHAIVLRMPDALRNSLERHTKKKPRWSKEHQVEYFKSVIGDKTPRKRRIILFESSVAMSETFASWWPSAQEAVRQRRKGGTVMGATTVLLSVAPDHMPDAAGLWGTNTKQGSRRERNAKRISALRQK